ncbi:sucrose-6-phosphate hydrolase [Soehngenia longivitae]|uniref:Sucrose-6-phosphate hydrolase n=1 Tax=Soehngenia longivitae TaxID=2562294 RepID=A0A4Z0D057_9FIRM|nr:sucrose-6-phosphate hydrolase [Soehngenia longivitae]TFZ39161.1 sucrose-6-phosphate hydrolase [Soehngenia longivitae]
MEDDLVYLDTYIIQQDMRIRMPKSILENLQAEKGKTRLEIYYDKVNDCLVLKKAKKSGISPEKKTNGEGDTQ